MTLLEKILSILQSTMKTPTYYGWFHLLFFAILIVACVFAVLYGKRANTNQIRKFLILCGVTMVAFEIYKQIIFTFNNTTEGIVGDYLWYAFPFQFCSTPMYLMLIGGIMKPCKLQKFIHSYLSTFAVFGGLCVYFYPNDVFMSYVGINIQTMIHHGLQIVVGCFLIAHYRKELNWKFYLQGVPVFLILCAFAIILNLTVPNFIEDTFNMFFISPISPCTLPLLDYIYLHTPYFVFLLIYLLGFCLAAAVVFVLAKVIIYVSCLISSKLKKHETVLE